MLEAVRGKLQRFLSLLEDKVATASSDATAFGAAPPASKTEEQGGEEEEEEEEGADGGSSTKEGGGGPVSVSAEGDTPASGSSSSGSGSKKEGGGGPVSVSAEVEMQELFFKLTLDTIGEIAFGRDLGSLRYG